MNKTKVLKFFFGLFCLTTLLPSVNAEVDLTKTIELTSPSPDTSSQYGFSIDATDNIIIIGEPMADSPEEKSVGAIHIYGSQGEFLRSIYSPTPKSGSMFGGSVATNGDLIVVGQYNQVPNSAHIFNKDGELITSLSPPSDAHRFFGIDVEITPDLILVGEPYANTERRPWDGFFHVYNHNGEFIQTIYNTDSKSEAFANQIAATSDHIVVRSECNDHRVFIMDTNGENVVTVIPFTPYDDVSEFYGSIYCNE
jgi:WD40 repeat protein